MVKKIDKNIKVAKAKGRALKIDAQKKIAIAKIDATAKGIELKEIAKAEYDRLKKEMNLSPSAVAQIEKKAIKEYEKLQKQMTATAKKVESYIKKNPNKAALISAGIGAALAGAASIMLSGDSKKKPVAKKPIAKKK